MSYLENHPLVGLIPADTPTPESPGTRLRAMLVDLIEQMKPPADAPVHSSRRRQYVILKERYVNQRPPLEIEKMLGLGERQLRREQQRAIATLSFHLRTKLAHDPARVAPGVAPDVDANTSLEEAVRRLAPAPRTFGLAELFDELARIVEQLGHRQHEPPHEPSRLVCEVQPPNASVHADRGILHQLLLKLLHFSVNEAIGDDGIFLSARALDNQVLFSLQARCADPVSADTEELQLGRLLAKALGAELSVESWEEMHTLSHIFRVSFALPSGARLRKVLVVDDEPAAAELYRGYLSGLNYEVVIETRPEHTLERADSIQPDAIVLDVMMPGIDGWELFQRLRNIPALRDTPIVVCSVIDEAELARALGATQFLKKPILRQQFIQTLDAVLARGN